MAFDDEVIPSQQRIEDVGDDANLKEVFETKPRPGLRDSAAVGKLCRGIDGYTGKGPLVRSG
jgi:hypothetical protein